MPTANIAPASAPEFQSYDRHECLYKFLMMKPFSAADFTKEMKLFPKEGRFFNSLCYMGVYKNTGITDFSAWLTECTAAVKKHRFGLWAHSSKRCGTGFIRLGSGGAHLRF